jgi:hypothetical protein
MRRVSSWILTRLIEIKEIWKKKLELHWFLTKRLVFNSSVSNHLYNSVTKKNHLYNSCGLVFACICYWYTISTKRTVLASPTSNHGRLENGKEWSCNATSYDWICTSTFKSKLQSTYSWGHLIFPFKEAKWAPTTKIKHDVINSSAFLVQN